MWQPPKLAFQPLFLLSLRVARLWLFQENRKCTVTLPPLLRGYCYRRIGTLLALLLALTMPSAQAQTTGFLSGTISLDGIVSNDPAQQINFEFSPTSGTATVFLMTAMITANGLYTLTKVPVGTYSVGIKGLKWLRAVVPVTVTTSPTPAAASATLTACDANNDNVVDNSDLDILVSAYNTSASVPGSGYDIRADFNCDGNVDVNDWTLFFYDYGSVGALYQITLDPPTSPSTGQIALKWRLLDADGNTMTTPGATLFHIYCSPTPGYTGSNYTTVSANPDANSNNSYTATVTNIGPYYYQIVALFPLRPAI